MIDKLILQLPKVRSTKIKDKTSRKILLYLLSCPFLSISDFHQRALVLVCLFTVLFLVPKHSPKSIPSSYVFEKLSMKKLHVSISDLRCNILKSIDFNDTHLVITESHDFDGILAELSEKDRV